MLQAVFGEWWDYRQRLRVGGLEGPSGIHFTNPWYTKMKNRIQNDASCNQGDMQHHKPKS